MIFNLKDYLTLIGLTEKLPFSFDTLCKIVEHQVIHVPYQNVDLFLMRQLDLSKRKEISLDSTIFFLSSL